MAFGLGGAAVLLLAGLERLPFGAHLISSFPCRPKCDTLGRLPVSKVRILAGVGQVGRRRTRHLRVASIGLTTFGIACILGKFVGPSLIQAVDQYAKANISLRDQLSSAYALPVGIASLFLSAIGIYLQHRKDAATQEKPLLGRDGSVAPESAEKGSVEAVAVRPLPFGAQPIFVDMMVTSVLIKKRSTHRRTSERLITACADHVAGYRISALAFTSEGPSRLSFRSLWGCSIETIRDLRVFDGSAEVLLRFPHPLNVGEKHYFSSETVNHHSAPSIHYYVNVLIDHLGIAAGELSNGYLPVGGLTVRVRFEDGDVPVDCWWYDDVVGRDGGAPRAGDLHRLTISAGAVSHTFTQDCRPNGDYGIAFVWGE